MKRLAVLLVVVGVGCDSIDRDARIRRVEELHLSRQHADSDTAARLPATSGGSTGRTVWTPCGEGRRLDAVAEARGAVPGLRRLRGVCAWQMGQCGRVWCRSRGVTLP